MCVHGVCVCVWCMGGCCRSVKHIADMCLHAGPSGEDASQDGGQGSSAGGGNMIPTRVIQLNTVNLGRVHLQMCPS